MNYQTQSHFDTGTRAGNGRLCHELRGLNPVRCFTNTIKEIAQQLTLVDVQNSHDAPLDDSVVEAASDWHLDHIGGALSLAHTECRASLECLRRAHAHVAGIFKGEMRDNTEEALARAIKGAEARLAQISAASDSYRLPKMPHEVRRNGLAFLFARSPDVIAALTLLIESCEGVGEDLLADLKGCKSELVELMNIFALLRERSSQKMEDNMRDCVARIVAINEHLDDIGIEAGKRGGNLFRYASWVDEAAAQAASDPSTYSERQAQRLATYA